ncbi:hypothetical protein BFL28_17390 [Sphingomonas turrisvirgatae]|uniref:DUF2336 domain-containing protein n=2 Tax=Sphingomonas turrisvirgatae TaxID=1888892 RepID=A0A1E3LV16_9SPHN|nr:hypothetical protein BFL28_17390 [Sphingomonas turrisvirgatae]
MRMSDLTGDMDDGALEGAPTLIAHAAAVDHAARHSLDVSIDDFFVPDEGRLGERTRLALGRLLQALIDTVGGEVVGHAVRLLRAQGEEAKANALGRVDLLDRLRGPGVLCDRALMAELIGRVRQELMAGFMPAQAPEEPDRPSLINRMVQHPDRVLAQAALAVLTAESRRRAVREAGPLSRSDLPAELHHRLVWLIAAALREECLEVAGSQAALDRALAESAQRSLAAHDEGDRLEAAVMRLAAAVDARADELVDLMTESLGGRRVTLFAGLLAHALGIEYPLARDIVLDADGSRLWIALRALAFGREAIARIGVALIEADPRRDVERFADLLDTIMAVDTDAARESLSLLRLPVDFRAAIMDVERRAR